jgi:hypothetical protein
MRGQPEVHGGRLKITAVQLLVRAGLLDDEHLDPKPQQGIQRRDVQLVGFGAAQHRLVH